LKMQKMAMIEKKTYGGEG